MHPFGYVGNIGLVCNIIKNLSIYYSTNYSKNAHMTRHTQILLLQTLLSSYKHCI
jgi:hypothetical protein